MKNVHTHLQLLFLGIALHYILQSLISSNTQCNYTQTYAKRAEILTRGVEFRQSQQMLAPRRWSDLKLTQDTKDDYWHEYTGYPVLLSACPDYVAPENKCNTMQCQCSTYLA